MPLRKASLVLVCAVAAAISAVPRECLAARWYEDYERAVELIDRGECSREAIQLLGAAVVEKPKPRSSARTIAVKVVDYYPYYQLARAHLVCGEIEAARDYLAESRKRGVAPADLLDELERNLEQVRKAGRPSPGPEIDTEELSRLAASAQTVIRQAIAANERIANQRQAPWLSNFFADNRARMDDAATDLREAESKLNEGTLKRDRSAIENAERIASRALAALQELEQQIGRVPTPRPTAAASTHRPTPQMVATAVPSPTARLATRVPTPIAASRGEPTPAPGTAGRRLPVPDSLRRAVSRYLAADYDDVIETLDPESYSPTSQRAAAHLLRGAALFVAYCKGGRRDDDQLREARSEVAGSLELEASLRPDPRFFSPEYIALFP